MSNSEAVGSNVVGTSIVSALLTKLRKQRATSYVVMDLPTLYITFSFTFVRGLCNVRARITSMQHMRAWASAAILYIDLVIIYKYIRVIGFFPLGINAERTQTRRCTLNLVAIDGAPG